MWLLPLIQGVIGCAVLLWFALEDWPAHVLAALVALPFPALFVFAALALRRQERELKPHRTAYLGANEAARRELTQARLIKWASIPLALLLMVLLFALLPPDFEASETFTWVAAGILIVLVLAPALYSSLVDGKIDAAARESSGEPPPTPKQKRIQTIAIVGVLALAIAIFAFDELVDSPISATTVFIYGGLIFAAAAFAWRKLRPPRNK